MDYSEIVLSFAEKIREDACINITWYGDTKIESDEIEFSIKLVLLNKKMSWSIEICGDERNIFKIMSLVKEKILNHLKNSDALIQKLADTPPHCADNFFLEMKIDLDSQ